jgi:hypothetical protein
MAVIKNTTKKCQRGCGEKECKLVQPLWKTVWRLLKKLKTTQTLYAHMNKRKNNKKKKETKNSGNPTGHVPKGM